jgi:uncharacterized membrane protein (DUF2068 family)
VYLLSHSHSDYGSIANRLARAIELDPHRHFIRHWIDKLGNLKAHQIKLFGLAALGYGVLELIEGVGLWYRQLWAEWLTVVATSLLIPFELYELARHPSALKAAGLLVNVLIVLYLLRAVLRKRRQP